jgi:GH24 family phage-related lysozyme (muramidase)
MTDQKPDFSNVEGRVNGVPTKPGKGIAAVVGAGLVFGSMALVDFIGKWEDGGAKTSYTVYADKLAHGLPTACRGITHYITDTPVVVGDVWSKAKCDAETAKALAKVQKQLLPCFKINPPQSVFDAATSHAWNFGAGKTCGSSAMQAWNTGDWALGCRRLLVGDDGSLTWVYSNKVFYRGLANRRADEMAFCWKDLK